MQEIKIDEPTMFILIGFPGAGKTFFARQFSEHTNAIHINEDRIRYEIYKEPTYSPQEDQAIFGVVNYMLEATLSSKQSVIVDGSNYRLTRRKTLRDMAKKAGYKELIVWVQTDAETAFDRASSRDRRHIDDKYSQSINELTFDRIMRAFKRPHYEEYVVISGKHVFRNQLAAVVRKVKNPSSKTQAQQQLQPAITNSKTTLLGGRVDLKRRALKPRIK